MEEVFEGPFAMRCGRACAFMRLCFADARDIAELNQRQQLRPVL